MKNVFFLVPDGRMQPSLLFLGIELFDTVNKYLVDRGGKPFYNIKIVGCQLRQQVGDSTIHIKAEDVRKAGLPDLVLMPGGSENNNYRTPKNQALTRWLIQQHQQGAELAGLCTGAFFLAATGLLNKMECTTHWKMANLLAAQYPEIELCSDKIITECRGIYTASGAVSSMNLILHLIEKYNGRQAAVYCAKMMHIDVDRRVQSDFVIFEGQKAHDDEVIKKMQNFIEKNVNDKITVEYLARKFSMPKRSLVRRFKKATHNLPLEYIQRTRVEAAKRKLETNRKSVNEIMYEVGYADSKAFRNMFKKIAGLSPLEYRKKYSQVEGN